MGGAVGKRCEAVQALRPRFEAAGSEMDRARRLPQDLVEALVEAGLFRLALPRAPGGGGGPAGLPDVAEALACGREPAGALSGSFFAAQVVAFLGPEAVREVFGDGKTVHSCGTRGEGLPDRAVRRFACPRPSPGRSNATYLLQGVGKVGGRGTSLAGGPAQVHLPLSRLADWWRTPGTSAGCGARGATPSPWRRSLSRPGGPLTWRDARLAGGRRCAFRLAARRGILGGGDGNRQGALDAFAELARGKTQGTRATWGRTRWCRTRWRG